MPPFPPPEERVALQLEDDTERYGGPGGGGVESPGIVDGDGD